MTDLCYEETSKDISQWLPFLRGSEKEKCLLKNSVKNKNKIWCKNIHDLDRHCVDSDTYGEENLFGTPIYLFPLGGYLSSHSE